MIKKHQSFSFLSVLLFGLVIALFLADSSNTSSKDTDWRGLFIPVWIVAIIGVFCWRYGYV